MKLGGGTSRSMLWAAAGFAVLLLASVAIAWPSLTRQAREWRARSLAVRAADSVRGGDLREGASKAVAAGKLSPDLPEVWRAQALVAQATGRYRVAHSLWSQLKSAGKASGDDEISRFECLLELGKKEAAGELLNRLESGGLRVDPAVLAKLKVRWLFATGEIPAGIAAGRKLIGEEGDEGFDPGFRLYLCGIMIAQEDPSTRAEGVKWLWQVAESGHAGALGACMMLLRSGELDGDGLERLARVPVLREGRGPEHLVLRASVSLRREPGRRKQILEKVAEEARTFDLEGQAQVGVFLCDVGETTLAEPLISPLVAKRDPGWFARYLDLLAQQGRWNEIGALLAERDIPISRARALLFMARCATEQGVHSVANARWDAAIREAETEVSELAYLANYAERRGWIGKAREACRKLMTMPSGHAAGFTGLVRIESRHGTTATLREALLCPGAPEMPERVAALAYLSFLLNLDLETRLEEIIGLAKQDPANRSYKVTIALGFLKKEEIDSAREWIDAASVSASDKAAWRWIRSAILRADGDPEGAAAAIEGVDITGLRPEELALAGS